MKFHQNVVGRFLLASNGNRYEIVAAWFDDERIRAMIIGVDGSSFLQWLPDPDWKFEVPNVSEESDLPYLD